MTSILIEVVEAGAWVQRARSFNTIEDFKLDENNVDGELCAVGQMLLEYGEAYAELKAEVARKKELTERMDAILYAKFRATLEKPTVGEINSAITNDASHQAARNEEIASTANLIKVEMWYKSLIQKIDCLKALAYKQRKELQNIGFGG